MRRLPNITLVEVRLVPLRMTIAHVYCVSSSFTMLGFWIGVLGHTTHDARGIGITMLGCDLHIVLRVRDPRYGYDNRWHWWKPGIGEALIQVQRTW